jgi:hypothetical protein
MFLRTALLTFSALAAAKEMPKDDFKAAELYDSGVRHANNVALKKVSCTHDVPFIISIDFELTLIAGDLG